MSQRTKIVRFTVTTRHISRRLRFQRRNCCNNFFPLKENCCRYEQIDLVSPTTGQQVDKLLKQEQFPGKQFCKTEAQIIKKTGIFSGKVQRTPLIEQLLPGNVNQRDTVQTAGHRAVIIDQAPTGFQQQTGRFVLLRHQRIPILLRNSVQQPWLDKNRIHFRQQFQTPGCSSRQFCFLLRGKQVKAALEIKCSEQGDIEEPPTAL